MARCYVEFFFFDDVRSEAFQLDKKSPDVLCVRALVLFISSKLPAATQHAQLALTYDPDHVRARTLLRRIREVERLKEEGNVAFRGEKWGEAVERYGDALEVVGEREEEAKGGAVRGVLLANRGAAYVKVRVYECVVVIVADECCVVDGATWGSDGGYECVVGVGADVVQGPSDAWADPSCDGGL